MCHSDNSAPPPPAGGVPAASQGRLDLRSADGTRVAAFAARPAERSGVGVVVLPDVRGLHRYYEDLAVRFAETGAEAVAVDWFGRTAPDDDRSEAFAFRPHVEQTTPEGVAADVAAAVAHLREQGARAVFTVGFCFGGGYSWRQSADTPGLAGAIGFYGRPSTAAEVVDRMHAPLLMLVAGGDAHIPVDDVRAVADAARSAGTEVRFEVFEGAPHSFFDRTADEHADHCRRAWEVIGAFVAEHS